MYYYDKPIETPKDDLLGRAAFSKLLAQTLFNLNSKDTFTVGLYGQWGTGKTSIVNMALSELKSLQQNSLNKTIVLHFEPWQFSDSNQLLNQFMIRLVNEFSNNTDKKMKRIGKALQDYSDAFSFAELIPVVGSPVAKVVKGSVSKIGAKMQNDISKKDVLQQKMQVIKLLQEQPAKILIVIDDIDRLSNEQIRQVFQLVSSVAKFPNTSYLLVFDKEIVVKALNKVQEGSGEDYLHKIIQMPIQIPDVPESKLHASLFSNLDKIMAEYKTPFQVKHWERLFVPCVSPFISNLRDVNRLLNSLRFKLTTISSEIEFSDMVAICAIEIGAPKIYEWIKKHKNALVGNPELNSYSTYKYTQNDWIKKYTAELEPLLNPSIQVKGYAKDKLDAILIALSHLFPVFAGRIGKHTYAEAKEVARKECFICDPDKFDRYFNLDIDDIFITKAQIEKVAFSYDSKELEKYILEMNSQGLAYELLENIKAIYPDLPTDRVAVVFLALINVLTLLDSKNSFGFLQHSAFTSAEFFAIDILNTIPTEQRLTFFTTALTQSSEIAIEALAHIINNVELAYGKLSANGQERTEIEKSFTLDELNLVEKEFSSKCKKILSNRCLFSLPKWRMTLHLLNSFEKEYISEHMQNAMKDDTNVVSYILDISSVWIGNGIAYEIHNPPYEYATQERIITAIDNLISSQELFSLDEDIQQLAAAFYLNSQGHTGYAGHISQKATTKFLNSKKNHNSF